MDGERLLSLLARAGAIEGKGHKRGVWHLALFPGLELRIGGYWPTGEVKQVQSVCPPTLGDDGRPREWNGVWRIAALPGAAYEFLDEIAAQHEAGQATPNASANGDGQSRPVRYAPAPGSAGISGPITSRLAAYLEGAIRRTGERVASLGRGECHDGLLSEAPKLFALVKGAGEPWITLAREALLDANSANGHAVKDPGDGEEVIRSAFEIADARDLSEFCEPKEGGRKREGNPLANGDAASWPVLAVNKLVRCVDRVPPNYGYVTVDRGDSAGLVFNPGEPDEGRATLHKSMLREPDGSPLGSASVVTSPARLASLSDADLGLTIAADIEAAPVRWLWPYRLACGAMALLAGDGGIGKSLVLLWIAARVSRGEPWGDGSGNAPIGDVIILSAEDRPEDTIVPRLLALGADLSRITIMRARVVIREEGEEPTVNPMTFQDRHYWREVFNRRPGCKLFIVDPLASYLGKGVNDSRNNDVRGVLEPLLTEVIEPRGICMLCNSHLNKSIDARSPIHRILGSIAFAALPRNVHIVARDPEDDARRIFAQAKCNNAPDDLPALAYKVERREVEATGGEMIETAVPVFEVEPVKIRLAELMAPKRDRQAARGEIDRATEWLASKLAAGPVGAILCARDGDRVLGRRWPDPTMPADDRRKIVLGRVKWWRERILKKQLGGESRRAGYNGPYLFRLPAHHWPPDPAAAVEAKRIDDEEMASTASTASTTHVDAIEE